MSFSNKVLVVVFLLVSSSASALDSLDSRVRLLVHGGVSLTDDVTLIGHIIPAGNLLGEVSPLSYIELNYSLVEQFKPSLTLAWAFGPDELILSTQFTGGIGPTWYWTTFEWQPQSGGVYWFARYNVALTDSFGVGAEEESFGTFADVSGISHGGGPNIYVRFGKGVQIDLSVHYRTLVESTGLEFVLRYHIFL